jgi:bifunctional UDP-N-acetylglucosamine pyrophosphorylase/glucosamine-1-phosphate N-acetyltransferase
VPADLHVVILAAGQGKRMHSALPKVLHPLAGKPIVAHVIDTARGLAPAAIALVYGHGGESVREALAAPDLRFVLQDPPRGTGDAVRHALAALPADGVTLVVLGDVPLAPPGALAALVAGAGRGHLALLTAQVADPHGLGRIVRDASGNVRAIVEEGDATPAQRGIDEINTGLMAAPTALLARWVGALRPDNAQNEYYLTDIIEMAVAEGIPVEAHVAANEDDVRGINDRAQLAAVERIVQRRKAEALLKAGTWIADPARIDVRGTLTCGRDVRIDVGCVFEGDVSLGDGAEIGANCVLRDVSVGGGTQVLPFCHLEGATIGAACRIGPFARMRPSVTLASEVHIGNFVELKATIVGDGSKANHLSYLGDTTIGRNVNVGAGTISCNYDGANKYRTVIEDGAFIGSDTQLVAPVTVGRNATIGAGTTLTRDAPPGALTLSRVEQKSRPDYVRPVKKK